MGSLVTLLALTRLFAPAPSESDSTHAAPAAFVQPDDGPLRPVVFARATGRRHLARDLRDPFDPSLRAAHAASPTRQAVKLDLRDPFVGGVPARRPVDTAPDLRDPFRPTESAPCPDTGGVPIQRPEGIQARCAQASRRQVFATR